MLVFRKDCFKGCNLPLKYDADGAPTSGFHHAMPDRGKGFCTFSGQVIAALKIYNKYKLSGAFIDLDGQKVDEIKDLINQTKKDCEQLILLNDAFKELDTE